MKNQASSAGKENSWLSVDVIGILLSASSIDIIIFSQFDLVSDQKNVPLSFHSPSSTNRSQSLISKDSKIFFLKASAVSSNGPPF